MTIMFLEIARRPKEGRPSEPFGDESTKEILTTLSSGDNLSLIFTQPPAENIPGVQLTRDTLSSRTVRAEERSIKRGGSRWQEV
jgi:hypothetical protein